MPTFKRYVMRRDRSILLFTRKPTKVLKNRWWDDTTQMSYPITYLQESEFDYKEYFGRMTEGLLYEVDINVKIRER